MPVPERLDASASDRIDNGAADEVTAPRWRRLGIHVAPYGVAIAIIWWLARGVPLAQLEDAIRSARLSMLVPVVAASVMCWLIGEAVLYARLLTFFYRPTTVREMLPATAVHEFLQTVNKAAAGSTFVLYISRRTGSSLLSAGCTMLAQAFIDLQTLAWMALAAALTCPAALMGAPIYVPPIAVVALAAFTWFWMRGRPTIPILRRLYDLPAMEVLRAARPSHYVRLTLIRAATFLVQAPVLYVEMRSFGLHAPLGYLIAFVPALLLVSSIPIAAAGLGPRQFAIVVGLAAYGPRPALLAMSLAHGLLNIVFRLPLGLFMPAFIRRLKSASTAALAVVLIAGLVPSLALATHSNPLPMGGTGHPAVRPAY